MPNQKISDRADSSEGASSGTSGTSAIVRNRPRAGMQLRVNACAKPKASGALRAVTSAETQTLFHSDCFSAAEPR